MPDPRSDTKMSTLSLGETLTETHKEKAEAFADTFSNVSSNKSFSPTFLQRKIDLETNKRELFSYLKTNMHVTTMLFNLMNHCQLPN